VLFSASLCLAPLQARAQSATIFGDDPDALRCYDNASYGVEMEGTTLGELLPCTRALAGDRLDIRDKAATYVNRGILSALLEDHETAMRDYDAAMRLHPSYGAIYVNRGNIFFLRKSYDEAIAEYTKALDADMSTYQVAYLNRGMTYEMLGRFKEAGNDYRRALEISPDWGQAVSKLARVIAKMN
jgi:tetratricopeptide (TPR) repeat protein